MRSLPSLSLVALFVIASTPAPAQGQFGGFLDMIHRLSGPRMTGLGGKVAVKYNAASIAEAHFLRVVRRDADAVESDEREFARGMVEGSEEGWDPVLGIWAISGSLLESDREEGDLELATLSVSWEPALLHFGYLDLGILLGLSHQWWEAVGPGRERSFDNWAIPTQVYVETPFAVANRLDLALQLTVGGTLFLFDDPPPDSGLPDHHEWAATWSLGLKLYPGSGLWGRHPAR